ncbi:hypothetical protein FCV43_15485 [Vibrio genomosp. F6]|uniref:hypothetical protein n=1 Tax=Vibrio TaxID=662 RepID=UPI0010BD46DF|nr:hypothetical protein [Vibrio genomosp. F6]TKF18907.1 hypothetical protein FCV43_15485 [Vibrio genomosp. F6]
MNGHTLIEEQEKYFNYLNEQGFRFDDARFQYVSRLSRLLMYCHDAMKSIILVENTVRYEPNDQSNEHILMQALFRNAVLNYTKCFSESGKGHITLDKKKVFKDRKDLLEVHDYIMELRHKFFAHSDNSGLDEICFATKEHESHIEVKQLYSISFPEHQFNIYLMLFKYCGDHVKLSIEKSFDNLEKQVDKRIVSFGAI